LDVFLTKPTLLTKFTWASTQATGTQLANFIVTPLHGVARTLDGVAGFCHTPMSLLNEHFEWWRGDFIYTFHFVKTPMHSGRIALVFTPQANLTPPAVATSLDNSVYALRTIVDLRESSTVSVQIPFNASTCYRHCQLVTESILGYLTMYVVDELVSPTTCPQTIEVLPWISAAPGFEFACPRNTSELPVFGLSIVATPQSGIMIGGYKHMMDDNMESSRKCIGERVTSLRQLLRVSRQLKWSTTYVTAPVLPGDVTIMAFMVQVSFRIGGVSNIPTHYGDLISLLSTCYLFSRGSMRIKLLAPDLPPEQVSLVLSSSLTQGSIVEGLGAYPDGSEYLTRGGVCNGMNVIVASASRGGFEVTVPQYSRTHSRSNAACISGAYTTRFDNAGAPQMVCFNLAAGRKLDILRSGGDDFNLGMFVSIPFVRVG